MQSGPEFLNFLRWPFGALKDVATSRSLRSHGERCYSFFQVYGGEDGKISGNKKRREKEIAKDAQRETAREKGQEGIKEVIVACRSAMREVMGLTLDGPLTFPGIRETAGLPGNFRSRKRDKKEYIPYRPYSHTNNELPIYIYQ